MAKRIFTGEGLTWNLISSGAVATASNYMALKSTLANQLVDILEVLISGTMGASNIGAFNLCRASTNSATDAALAAPHSDGGLYPSITALATVITSTITSTTQPVLSGATTDAKLQLGQNVFGGIIRWNAAPTQQWQLLGATAPGAQTLLANLTGGTGNTGITANAHIIYEPY